MCGFVLRYICDTEWGTYLLLNEYYYDTESARKPCPSARLSVRRQIITGAGRFFFIMVGDTYLYIPDQGEHPSGLFCSQTKDATRKKCRQKQVWKSFGCFTAKVPSVGRNRPTRFVLLIFFSKLVEFLFHFFFLRSFVIGFR